MNEWPVGEETGRKIYLDLLNVQNTSQKRVYVLASHSHFFMDGIFNTDYWQHHGSVLPGWIIGTAGAERYPLPLDSQKANAAKTNVYGYLLATVNPPGQPQGAIQFDFQELEESQIPTAVVDHFTQPFVHECFSGNRRMQGFPPPPNHSPGL